MITNPQFTKTNSAEGERLHTFLGEIKFNISRRGNNYTIDRTCIEKNLIKVSFHPKIEALKLPLKKISLTITNRFRTENDFSVSNS